MNISDRVKRFIKHTNGLCIVMEDGEPEYILTSFDWAERMMLPQDEETHDLSGIERLNDDISLVAEEEKSDEFPVA